MKTALKEIMKYPTCDKSRDELIAIFNSLRTSSNSDRFHFIRCWNGTLEEEPVNLAEGLVAEESVPLSDNPSDAKVALPASGELKEAVKD